MSIRKQKGIIFYNSLKDETKIRWKSNPPRGIGRSTDENCIHGGGNVLKQINGAFLVKDRRKMR